MTDMGGTSFIRPQELWQTLGLRADQTVVHLGCGAGFYLIPAAKIVGKHGKVIGLDVLTNMLEEAEGRARRSGVGEIVETVRANLEEVEGSTLPAQSADWVLVANILHQAAPAALLREAKRVVRNSGTVVVIEWDTAATPLGPPAEKRVGRAVVVSVAQEQGLTVQRFFNPSPYHYGILLTPAA